MSNSSHSEGTDTLIKVSLSAFAIGLVFCATGAAALFFGFLGVTAGVLVIIAGVLMALGTVMQLVAARGGDQISTGGCVTWVLALVLVASAYVSWETAWEANVQDESPVSMEK